MELRSDDFAFVYLDVDHPPIAWLVYRGLLNSCDIRDANPGNLSWFLLDVIKRGIISTLRREGSLEGFRLRDFPRAISRLSCVYAYPTLRDAELGSDGRGKFRKENLVAIAPKGEFRSELYDQVWIDNFDPLPLETARKYWAGDQTDRPKLEYLLQGRFWILGTSVRKRAYATLKNRYPNCLAMLELSRLAVEFGSDLGSISPWLAHDGSATRVTHVIRYSEAEGMAVFEQTLKEKERNPKFEVNWADLEPLCRKEDDSELDARFVVPDLRQYDHELRQDKASDLSEFVNRVLCKP